MTALSETFFRKMAQGLLNRSREPATDVWPQPVFNPGDGNDLVANIVFRELYDMLYINQGEFVPYFEIGPSRIAHLLYLTLTCPKDHEEGKKRGKVLESLLELIRKLRNNDIWCDRGNIVLDDSALSCLIRSEPISCNTTKKLMTMVIAMLSSFLEMTFFCNLAFGREQHGPYSHNNETVLIRDFYDFNPSFWQKSKELPNRITLITSYIQVEAKFDFAGRMFTIGNLRENLNRIAIIIDGNQIDNEKECLFRLDKLVREALRVRGKESASCNKIDLVKKYCLSTLWAMKAFTKDGDIWFRNEENELTESLQAFRENNYTSMVFKNVADNKVYSEALDYLTKQFDPEVCDESIGNKVYKA